MTFDISHIWMNLHADFNDSAHISQNTMGVWSFCLKSKRHFDGAQDASQSHVCDMCT